MTASVFHFSFRQGLLQEYTTNGIEIIMRWHIHHCQVLVVEQAVCFGAISIALDQIGEEFEMLVDVAIHVHGHEAGQLNEAGINELPTA